MTRPYSADLRSRVVTAVEAEESRRSAALRFGVAPSTAAKWMNQVMRTGSISPDKMGGHRKPILKPHRDWLLARVEACPQLTLRALQALLAARGVTVNHDTVWRFLRACGLTFEERHWSQ